MEEQILKNNDYSYFHGKFVEMEVNKSFFYHGKLIDESNELVAINDCKELMSIVSKKAITRISSMSKTKKQYYLSVLAQTIKNFDNQADTWDSRMDKKFIEIDSKADLLVLKLIEKIKLKLTENKSFQEGEQNDRNSSEAI